MRSLITGVGGFVGQHLAAHLLRQGLEVWGVARNPIRWHVEDVEDDVRFSLLSGDLSLRDDALAAVERARADHVYHLAGMSSVPDSYADPVGTLTNNAAAQVNILEAVRSVAPRSRVLVVSSAEIYGRAGGDAPIDETATFWPENPYAVSKATQDLLAYQYGVSYALDIVRVRPFNHIGPGQSERFVASSFGRQIACIETGREDAVMRVGNLSPQRDFTDVRDMVRAYELALLSGETGAAYNLGTGVGISIGDLLERFLMRSKTPVAVEVDQDRLRRTDAPFLVCDSVRFRERTRWQPTIPLDTTVEDILAYWRAQVAA